MEFTSDNVAAIHPAVMAAMVEANQGTSVAYGDDPLTGQAAKRIAEVFETDCAVFLIATGSAANSIGLATLCPSYGAIVCHEGSHIQTCLLYTSDAADE